MTKQYSTLLTQGFIIWISTLIASLVLRDLFHTIHLALKIKPIYSIYLEQIEYLISIFIIGRILLIKILFKVNTSIKKTIWTGVIILCIYLILKYINLLIIWNILLKEESIEYHTFSKSFLPIIKIQEYKDILKYIIFGISILSIRGVERKKKKVENQF
jgi:hypothetical protein